MWKRIIAYTLFLIGILGYFFFKHYSGTIIPHPFILFLIAFTLLFSGVLLLRNTETSKQIKSQKIIAEAIKKLKTNGEKIVVDFSKCEVKENSYTEQEDRIDKIPELLEFAYPNYFSNKEIDVDVEQSVIVFNYKNPFTNNTETFISRAIPKDRITLSFLLDKQKQTILYVDKSNRKKYYFDLSFLNDE